MEKKSYAVIGLGQFGSAIVEELVEKGADVIAIDHNEEVVKKISAILPTAFIADSTNEQALEELNVTDVDAAIVAYGDNKEASVLTTVILRELGIKQIIVRVDDPYYVPIMRKLGATEVIQPQKAAGVALANRLGNDDLKDFHKLDDKYSVVSILLSNAFVPCALKDISTRQTYGVNIVLIKRDGRSFVPGGSDNLLPNDTIFVVGSTKEITSFSVALNSKK